MTSQQLLGSFAKEPYKRDYILAALSVLASL